MIKSSRIVYEFDLAYDRFDGKYKPYIRLEDKLNILNQAQEIYFENRVNQAETNAAVRHDLRNLEIKEQRLDITERNNKYVISQFPKDHFRTLRRRVVANKENCGNKELSVVIAQSDDLNNMRTNPYWRSSFEWEHVLGDEGSKGLYLWHENEFDIKEVYIDYYRKPNKIQAPSLHENGQYVDWDGELITRDQDLELDSTYSYKDIVDIAVLISFSQIGDGRDYQIKVDEILRSKQL